MIPNNSTANFQLSACFLVTLYFQLVDMRPFTVDAFAYVKMIEHLNNWN